MSYAMGCLALPADMLSQTLASVSDKQGLFFALMSSHKVLMTVLLLGRKSAWAGEGNRVPNYFLIGE